MRFLPNSPISSASSGLRAPRWKRSTTSSAGSSPPGPPDPPSGYCPALGKPSSGLGVISDAGAEAVPLTGATLEGPDAADPGTLEKGAPEDTALELPGEAIALVDWEGAIIPDDTPVEKVAPSPLFDGTGTDTEGPAAEDTGSEPETKVGASALEEGADDSGGREKPPVLSDKTGALDDDAMTPDEIPEGRVAPPLVFDSTDTDAEGPALGDMGTELGARALVNDVPPNETAEGRLAPPLLSDDMEDGPLLADAEGLTLEDVGSPPPSPDPVALADEAVTLEESPDGRVAPPPRVFEAPALVTADPEASVWEERTEEIETGATLVGPGPAEEGPPSALAETSIEELKVGAVELKAGPLETGGILCVEEPPVDEG
ncbi:hypothetical protein B0H11DRAFT_2216260 [Mycena galericulata]|nr:hypothetical protein B0H11DRAFT_2216260 [Mycena galericulata]